MNMDSDLAFGIFIFALLFLLLLAAYAVEWWQERGRRRAQRYLVDVEVRRLVEVAERWERERHPVHRLAPPPNNPADILRTIASMPEVQARFGFQGVDHKSFDRAAEECAKEAK